MQRLLLIAVAVSLMTGCSYLKSTTHLDLSPFAENTLTLAAEVEYGLTETSRAVNLRDYWHLPSVDEHRKEWDKVRVLLKAVVAYSVEVTTLGNSTLTGQERCDALADYLDPLARPVVEAGQIRITPAKLDSIVADIRTRKTLLDGLNAAQPIIDEVARISDNIFDGVRVSLDNTARAIMEAIDADNAKVVEYDKMVTQFQYRTFDVIVLFSEARKGNMDAMAEMLETDPQLREYTTGKSALTVKQITEIESRLLDKTKWAEEFANMIAPDIQKYHQQQKELADIYTDAAHQLRRAKVTMIVWSRAHRNLALGVTDPARVNMFDLTKKALKTAL